MQASKFIKYFLSVLAVVVCLKSVSAIAELREYEPLYEVNVLANARPYMWNENGVAAGPDADFIREIARKIGIRIKFNTVPMKRSLVNLKTGKAHFGVGFKTPGRAEYLDFVGETPLHWSIYRIFVKEGGEINFRSIEDLYGKRIGMNRGFAISPEFDRAVRENKIEIIEADSVIQLVKILLAGRVEAIAGNPLSIEMYYRKIIHEDGIFPLVDVSSRKGSYLMMSKSAGFHHDREELKTKISQAMKELVDDGTVEKIDKKYPDFVYYPESLNFAQGE